MDFSQYKFRCSALHVLAMEPKDKAAKEAGELSATAKQHLCEVYAEAVYDYERKESNKYFEKGTRVEEQSITLLSSSIGEPLFKNTERLTNDWITGEWDICTDIVYDVKSSWDLISHLKKRMEQTPQAYVWQIQGYLMLLRDMKGLDLPGGKLAHCLVDTPDEIIESEVRRMKYSYPSLSEQEEEEYRRTFKFDYVPLKHRVFTRAIFKSESNIAAIPSMVEKGRKFLQDLHNMQNL